MVPPKDVYLPISKPHSVLAVANLLAHNNISQTLLWASKFAAAKIECTFEMGKQTLLGVTFILLMMVPNFKVIHLIITILRYNIDQIWQMKI